MLAWPVEGLGVGSKKAAVGISIRSYVVSGTDIQRQSQFINNVFELAA
jgi:hypothetical protein